MSSNAAGWTGPEPAPKESVVHKIIHWFHDAGVWVGHAFVALVGKDAAQKFAAGAVALLKTQVGQIALQAVTDAAKLETNQERFAQAGANILAAAATAGLAVTGSMKNLLIELAVQQLKLNFGPNDAPPAS